MSHILFINHTRQLHGSEQVLLESMHAAQMAGHRVSLLLPSHVVGEGLDEAAAAYATTIFYAPYRPIGFSLLRTWLVQLYNLCALWRVIRFIRREKVDIVFSGTSVTTLGLLAARATSKKHIWHFHEPVDAQYGWHPSLRRLYTRLLTYSHNTWVCISRHQHHEWQEAMQIPMKSMVIYNPIRTVNVSPAVHEGLRIGYMGSFDARKNIPLLLQVFEKIHKDFPNTRLLLCGAKNTDEIATIYAQTTLKAPVLQVQMHTQNIDAFYSDIDIFVLPSLREEMPLVVLEAMQAGICVLQTSASHMKELLTEEHTLFFSPDQPEQLEQQLRDCMDASFRKRLALHGQKRVEELNCTAAFQQSMQQLFAS